MAFQIDSDVLTVNSRHAWVVWPFYALFLFIFPVVIWAMWTSRSAEIPLWFNTIFTGLFLAAAPFLIREMCAARLVRARLDGRTGRISVRQRGLFSRSSEERDFADILQVEMRTTDNDGEFHTLRVVFRDGSGFAFLHGNHRQSVEEERDRFLGFLHRRLPGVKAVEVFA